jgi:acyl-CoA reductase-like NAD-dependent aldehyde dehydrogenase
VKAFFQGEWRGAAAEFAVHNPYDGAVIDSVPDARAADVELAIQGAVDGAAIMRATPACERSAILRRAANILRERQQELGALISREEGKILAEGIGEAGRAIQTLDLSADEARRLGGEQLPLDAAPGAESCLGFTLRVPCGVVAAITPFNFPLNLVCHKVGPALAAGNSVIIKPASDTPLSALKLVEILLEAGLPPLGIACITGGGEAVGAPLCRDPRVRKISFTGSVPVGKAICEMAGLKRVTMELGSNSPIIVMEDADLDKVVRATVATGFANAGQVCISAQRVIAHSHIYEHLLDALLPAVRKLTTGDQLAADTQVGPMIREREALRVGEWIGEAVAGGARLLCGGERAGALAQPALLAEVTPDMRVCRDELFGPAVGTLRADSFESAIAMANDSRYGLSASIFTQDIDRAIDFARRVDSGNLHINWGPAWRADLMPYGGLKESGFGKEGPRYAIEEMTELKAVVIHS